MNILILGGAGFVGNNLVRRILAEGGHNITVVDSLDVRLKSTADNLNALGDAIEFIQGDTRDRILMAEVVANKDVIFNCAAQTSHPLSLSEPLFDAEMNCLGTLTVLEAVKTRNPKALVIYVSSSTVIGKADGVVDETHGERPLDIYSANKGVAEKYHWIYHRAHGLKTLSIRFANLFGPYGKGYPEFGFVNYFISLAHHDQEIKIFGDGHQKRNVLYIEDAVEVLWRCVSHPELLGGIYFAVHHEHHSVMDIAKGIVSAFARGKITQVPWPEMRKRIEIDDVSISPAKLYKQIGFTPKYDLRSGLIKTRDTFQQEALL